MKTIKRYTWTLLFCTLAMGCNSPSTTSQTDVAVVIDKTDHMPMFPNAGEIVGQLGLTDDPWKAVRVTATYASDVDVNEVKEVTLEAENKWLGNLDMRKTKIKHFVTELQQVLNTMKYTGTCPRSIVYRAIARQANRLASSTATQRYLLIYSDLVENDVDLDFYNAQTLKRLQKSPASIDQQLKAEVPLKPLTGLNVWFIYNPTSFAQNNGYMVLAGYYSRLFSNYGATTHIANKFQPL